MGARIAWKFYDPVTLETYSMEVNPKSDSNSRAISKSIGYEVAAGYNGQPVIFENPIENSKFSYSGTILTQQQFNDLYTWFNKPRKLVMQDDLGFRSYVYITKFEAERLRSKNYAWKHEYTLEGFFLAGTPDPI